MTSAFFVPDPHSQPEFYANVSTKRAIAWVLDVAIVALLAGMLSLPFLVLGLVLIVPLLFIPLIWAFADFVYRWTTISLGSATLGMRFMSIELRDRSGMRLDSNTAFFHTAGTVLSFAIFPLQLISAASMVLTERGQGLSDMILGTTMLNRGA